MGNQNNSSNNNANGNGNSISRTNAVEVGQQGIYQHPSQVKGTWRKVLTYARIPPSKLPQNTRQQQRYVVAIFDQDRVFVAEQSSSRKELIKALREAIVDRGYVPYNGLDLLKYASSYELPVWQS
jgi:hypothetical protein